MSFAVPGRLWLLILPAIALLLVVLRHRARLFQQRRLASPAVWRRLLGAPPATGLIRLALWCAAAAFVVVAIARPQWGELPVEESIRTRDLVFAVDVSDSMLCPDLRPTRLGRSLDEIQRSLPLLEGNRVAVVVFAGDAYPLVPLTTDLSAVATFVSGIEPGMVALAGSNLEHALQTALRLLPDEGEGRVVVLFTDGENLQGDMAAAAGALERAGVGVIAAVVGTEAGGPIPVVTKDGRVRYKTSSTGQPVMTRARRDVLEELVEATGGEIIELAGRDAMQRLTGAVEGLRTMEAESNRKLRRVERFPVFVGAALLLLVGGFAALPWRRWRPVLALWLLLLPASMAAAQQSRPAAHSSPAKRIAAAKPEQEAVVAPSVVEISLWQRLIPGGSRRLARSGQASWMQGDLEAAVSDFLAAHALDPTNIDRQFDLGTSLAAAGAFDPAVVLVEQAHRGGAEHAAYNLGTALLRAGRAELAVRWLREALLARPEDEEVKRNYELALRLLELQQQQQRLDEQQDEQQGGLQQEQQQQSSVAEPQPAPTPTPGSHSAIFAALERAEAKARDGIRAPTPQVPKVERDW